MKKVLMMLLVFSFLLPHSALSESIYDREWLDISFVHKREYTLPETH